MHVRERGGRERREREGEREREGGREGDRGERGYEPKRLVFIKISLYLFASPYKF